MDDFDQTQAIVLEGLDEDATDELNPDEDKKPVGTLKVLFQKGLNETSYPLYEGDNVIGRSSETSHICIPSKSLSKEHACIQIIGDSHLIYDKGSRNKTRRGKLFLTPEVRYELKSGDELLFADVQCEYTKLFQESKPEDDSDTDGSESFLLQAESTLEISDEGNTKAEENNNKNEVLQDSDDEDIFIQSTQPFTKNKDKIPDIVIQESPLLQRDPIDPEIKTLVLSESESEEGVLETPRRKKGKSDKSAVEETQLFDDSDSNASTDFSTFAQATQAYNLKSKENEALLGAATQAYGGFEDDDDDNVQTDDEKSNKCDQDGATQYFVQPEAGDTLKQKGQDKISTSSQLAQTQSFDADGGTSTEAETQSFDIVDMKDQISVKDNKIGYLNPTQDFEEEDDASEKVNDDEMFAMATLAPVKDSDEEVYDEDDDEDDEEKDITKKEEDASKMCEPTQHFDTFPNESAKKVENNTVGHKKSTTGSKTVGDTMPLGLKDDDLPTQVFDETLPAGELTNKSPLKALDGEAPTQIFDKDLVDADKESSTQNLPTQVFDATVAVPDTVSVSDTVAIPGTIAISETVAVSDTVTISDTVAVSDTLALDKTELQSKDDVSEKKGANIEEIVEDEEGNNESSKEVEEMETQAYGMGCDIETQAYELDESEEEEEDGDINEKRTVGREPTQAYALCGDEDQATQDFTEDETQAFTKSIPMKSVHRDETDKTKERDDNPETCVLSEDDSDMEEMSLLQPKGNDGEPAQVFEMEIDNCKSKSTVEPTLAYSLEVEENKETKTTHSTSPLKKKSKGKVTNPQEEDEKSASASSSALSIEIPIPSKDSNPWVGESQYSPDLDDIGKDSKFISCLDMASQSESKIPDSLESNESANSSIAKPPLIPLPSQSPLKPSLVQGEKQCKRSPSPTPKRVAFTDECKKTEELKASRITRKNSEKSSSKSPQNEQEISSKNRKSVKGKGKGKRSNTALKKDEGSSVDTDSNSDINDKNERTQNSANAVSDESSHLTEKNGTDNCSAIKAKPMEENVRKSGRRVSRSSLLKDFETTETTDKKGQKGGKSKKNTNVNVEQVVIGQNEKDETSAEESKLDSHSALALDVNGMDNSTKGDEDLKIPENDRSKRLSQSKKDGDKSPSKRGKKQSGKETFKAGEVVSDKDMTLGFGDVGKISESVATTRKGKLLKMENTKESKQGVSTSKSQTAGLEEQRNTNVRRGKKKLEDLEKEELKETESVKTIARKGGRRTTVVDDDEEVNDDKDRETENVEKKKVGRQGKRAAESLAGEVANTSKRMRRQKDLKVEEVADEKDKNELERMYDIANRNSTRRGTTSAVDETNSNQKGKKRKNEKLEDTEKRNVEDKAAESLNEESIRTSSRRGRKQSVLAAENEGKAGGRDETKKPFDSNDDQHNEVVNRGGRRRQTQVKVVVGEEKEEKKNVRRKKEKDSSALLVEEKEETITTGRKGRKTVVENLRHETEVVLAAEKIKGNENNEKKLLESSPIESQESAKPSSSRQRRTTKASANSSLVDPIKKSSQNKSEEVITDIEHKQEGPKGRSSRKKVSDAISTVKVEEEKDAPFTELKKPVGRKSVRESKIIVTDAVPSDPFQKPATLSSSETQSRKGRKRMLDDEPNESDEQKLSSKETPKKKKLAEESLSSQSGNSQEKRGKIADSLSLESSQGTPKSKKAKLSTTITPVTPRTPSQRHSLSSSQQMTSSPSLRKSTIDYKPRVMFTGVIDQKGEKIVKDLGGELATSIQRCTHLVTDKIRRTVKFLGCLAKGVPIITPLWLENCKRAGTFLDAHPFLVTDSVMEKQFNFKLSSSITKAQTNGPLFQEYQIHVTKSVKPDPNLMKDILDCAGAEYLTKMPSKAGDKRIVISCPDDEKLCKPAVSAGIPITGAEFILSGILKQELDADSHALFTTKQSKPAGKGKAKK